MYFTSTAHPNLGTDFSSEIFFLCFMFLCLDFFLNLELKGQVGVKFQIKRFPLVNRVSAFKFKFQLIKKLVFRLAPFHLPSSHLQPLATVLDSGNLELLKTVAGNVKEHFQQLEKMDKMRIIIYTADGSANCIPGKWFLVSENVKCDFQPSSFSKVRVYVH